MRHGPYVFYNQGTGDRFKDVKLGLKNAVKRAGLKGITWHTFRHTFASRLVRHGADIVTVKELLANSTIVATMRDAHSKDESKRRASRSSAALQNSGRSEKPRFVSGDSVEKDVGNQVLWKRRNGRAVEGGGLENR